MPFLIPSLIAILMLFAAPARDPAVGRGTAGTGADCTNIQPNEVSCALTTGVRTYRLDSTRSQYLRLTNTTALPLQIEAVQGVAAGRGRAFLEYCVSRNSFETGQSRTGQGEVACTSRNDGVAISALRLGIEGGRGLTVDPGDTIYVSFSPMPTEPWFTVTVTAAEAKGRLSAWRQPRIDQVIRCNGREQQTRWAPWTNTGDHSVTLQGAVIYAQGAEQPPDRVDAACLYVLNTEGAVRYRRCDGVNHRNPDGLQIPAQTVAPGEAVAGQATHTCPSPGVWGWAAYMTITE